MIAPPAPQHRDDPNQDRFVHMHDCTWADYLRVLKERGERSAPRISYLDGTIEIMSPSRSHEAIKSLIGCLVEVWCLERGVEFSPYGAWTLKDKRRKRGLEGDECYVFGVVAEPRIPDLAIEVVWSPGRLIDKLEIYRGLGVREVWYWRKRRIEVYVLRGAAYARAPASEVLAGIDVEQIVSVMDRPTTSQAIRDYRALLQSAAVDPAPARD